MEKKIIALIASVLKVPVDEVTLSTEIGELDEWDSLNNLRIIANLEKTFDVRITSEMLVDLEDVSDIISLIKELTN